MSEAVRIVAAIDEVPADEWDALHDGTHPFVAHAFLAGLERHGCLRPAWGWEPQHALLLQGGRIVAAAPGYRKHNSHGEFVFDHAWANAYERFGRDYYPKWLFAVPYSPVTGPRLLAGSARERAALAAAIGATASALGVSSAHVNFVDDAGDAALGPDWLERLDVQFHWQDAGWRDFTDFLDAFVHKRRKAIRQERERVQRDGYRYRIVHGNDASDSDLAAMHGFYCSTFAAKGNSPALTLDFLRHLATTMPRSLVLILAQRDGRTVAGAMCLRGGDTLYGRYWGSDDASPGLHFETCYYQGIDYCLREGLQRFEPGAQGEHKLARGFLPTLTRSRHRVLDPAFAEALAPWCAQEREATRRYRALMLDHSPFRRDDPPAAPAR